MLAGGLGNIRAEHVEKRAIRPGDLLIVLGGPAMLIGLGGGAASSQSSADKNTDLDFASVQRDNAEMERRAQEVIDRCWQLGDQNPILSIHDVGAGGLSNAFPELVKDGGVGGIFDLAAIPQAEAGLSPLEVWCNEAQERYVLALAPEHLAALRKLLRTRALPLRRRRPRHRRARNRPGQLGRSGRRQPARSTSRSPSSSANHPAWSEAIDRKPADQLENRPFQNRSKHP